MSGNSNIRCTLHEGDSLRAKAGNIKVQELLMKENVSGRHKLLPCLCIKQKENFSIKLSKFLYYELNGKFILCCYCLVIQSCSTL